MNARCKIHLNRELPVVGPVRACEKGVQEVHRTRARAYRGTQAQRAQKSLGFRVKFWYRTITP